MARRWLGQNDVVGADVSPASHARCGPGRGHSGREFLRYALPTLRPVALVLGLELVASTVLAGVSRDHPLTSADNVQVSNIFAPVSPPAQEIADLSQLFFVVCAGIFLFVAGLLSYSIVRFRSRPADEGREPPQVYGSNPIELAWTVVPLLVVFVLFLVTMRTVIAIERNEPTEDDLHVDVVGHQWWWEFRYPELGIVTANELHVPVSGPGTRRPVLLQLESADVVHSFWIPRLNGKTDVIPNRVNHMWIEPMATGTYLGQCAEYCGTQHAHMLLRVIVHTEADFDRWVADQRNPAAAAPEAAAGRAIFERTACISCHRVSGTVADGRFGPDLTHIMSRHTIGSGVAANTPENLRAWIRDPQQLKPGARMPDMKLSDGDVDKVVAYLATLE